ncbi:MAG: F0F1 ATP synthase subunit B [Chthoniobacteraceae bacterium]
MTIFTILAANPIVEVVEPIARQFGVDWWKLLSQCISFSIVVFVLQKYAYKPILDVLAERRQKIADGLANAAEIKKQLAAAQEQAAEILAKANAQAQKSIDEARTAAKALGEKESQRAIIEAEQIITKAREATQREHNKMLADLKREVARLVIETTSKVTGKVLSDADQRRLSEEAARELAA